MPHGGQRGRRRGGARSFWGGLARVAGDYIADQLPFYHHEGGAHNPQRQHNPQGGRGGYPSYPPLPEQLKPIHQPGGPIPNYAPVLPGEGGGGSGAGQASSAFERARPDWKFERKDEDSEEEKQEGEELAALHDGDDDDDSGENNGANQEYKPARIKGGVPHPGHVVQSVAMAAAEPPPITYKLRLPRRLLDSGALSLLQAEAVFYCMQMHETRLPNGERAGWMLGDGTGIGKGRILASIMLENSLHGRDRAVWVTASPFLATQIRRDARDVGTCTHTPGSVGLWVERNGCSYVNCRTVFFRSLLHIKRSQMTSLILSLFTLPSVSSPSPFLPLPGIRKQASTHASLNFPTKSLPKILICPAWVRG